MASQLLNMLRRGFASGAGSPLALSPTSDLAKRSERASQAKILSERQISNEEMEQQLAQLLGGSLQIRPGQVILFDAAKLSDHFGRQWDALAGRAETMVCQAIENHLAREDSYTRLDRLVYLLHFSNKAADAAEALAIKLVIEAAEKIVGSSWTPASFILRSITGSLPDGLETKTIPIPGRGTSVLETVVRKLSEAEQAEKAASQSSASTVIYRPMWDVKYGALSTYLAAPAIRASGAPVREAESGVIAPDGIDIDVAQTVAADIGAFIDTTGKILVGIPVHFDTLAASGRRVDFLRACSIIPAAARHLLIYELVDAPSGVPASRLQDVCSELKRQSRALTARVSIQTRDFTPYASAGFNAVGVDLSQNRNPEHLIIDQMQQFAIAADRARIQCFVHGLRSTSLASSAVAAGFRYIDGQSVHSLVEGLHQLRRFGAADLYASLFSGSRPADT